MNSIFVAHWFDTADRDLVTHVDELLHSHGVVFLTGRVAGGRALDDAVKDKINQCDGLIALATRREQLAEGGWVTHPWVIHEFDHAKGRDKETIAIVEDGVQWEGMHAGHGYIPLDRGRMSEALLKLSQTVGEWREKAGKVLKLRILPNELAERLKTPEQAFECQCRFLDRGSYSDWRDVVPVPEPGAVFLYLTGVREDRLIEVRVRSNRETWQSPATPQFMPIELEQV